MFMQWYTGCPNKHFHAIVYRVSQKTYSCNGIQGVLINMFMQWYTGCLNKHVHAIVYRVSQ